MTRSTPASPATPPTDELDERIGQTDLDDALGLGPVDPLAEAANAVGVAALCDRNLELARRLLTRVERIDLDRRNELTFETVLEPLDLALWSIENGADYAYLLGVAHADESVRQAARDCESKAEALRSELWMSPALAARVQAFAATQGLSAPARAVTADGADDGRPGPLSAERRRFVGRALQELRRRGAMLGPHAHHRLRRIDEELTALGQQFVAAITTSVGQVRVPPERLTGLPASFVAAHRPEADGLVTLRTDYPDYFPVVTYATDRRLARDLFVAFVNRGGRDNLRRLDRMLALRYEKAQLLGYRSWADYVLESRMAGSVGRVEAFLERSRQTIAPLVRAELDRFRQERARLGGDAGEPLSPPDRYYLAEKIRRRRHGLDSSELSEYFDVEGVTAGLLELVHRMFGLEFRKVAVAAWHEDVQAYDVVEGGEPRGRIFLDLGSRPGKYQHSAMFPIRPRRRLPGGAVQTPQAALLCNFPEPGAPMPHHQVVTYFHEFGHLLHHLLTTAELSIFAGTGTARDFVEVPSQLFEQWAFSWEVLRTMAKHRRTGAPLPPELYRALVGARHVGLALDAERQLFLATLDLEYHRRRPDFDTTEVLRQVRRRTSSFDFVAGTHFQSSFGHLVGYDAGYYGYPWAVTLAFDAFSRFERAGVLDPATALAWRQAVLCRGGSVDERRMLEQFLGRPPSDEAYRRFLAQGR